MVDIPIRLKKRGGVGLPSREEFHIYKLPSYSKFTRKHEPVDMADVMWMSRPGAAGSDPSRINENIREYARGVNPSVEVDYGQGSSPASRSSSNTRQPGSVYKLDRVVLPLFPVETTHSLSNPRTHQTITVETNPGLPNGYATNTLADSFDSWEIGNALNLNKPIGPKTMQSTPSYIFDFPSEMSASYAINQNRPDSYEMMTNPGKSIETNDFISREQTPYGVIVRPTYSVVSNVKFRPIEDIHGDASSKVRKETLLKNIKPNFQVVVYDPANHVSTEVQAGIRQKNYIAVQAALGQPISLNRDDGTPIKLSNYTWTAVNTNLGSDQLILSVEQPEIRLERNLPLYAATSGLTAPMDMTEKVNQEHDLQSKVSVYAQPSVNLSNVYDMSNARNMSGLEYYTKPALNFSFDNQVSHHPQDFQRELPQLRDISRLQKAAVQGYERTFDS